MHQQNNICVGALHFDPWCTLNLISSHDHFPGLSLVTAPGVKIGCINTTFLVLEHSILTLGALLTYYLANTSHIITSQASHCIGATIRIGREIQCLPYAGFLIPNCPTKCAQFCDILRGMSPVQKKRTYKFSYLRLYVVQNLHECSCVRSHVLQNL